MGEAIVITSGKGGVGKTTTTANIGTGLAMLGNKVVLIDTDIGLKNLDIIMGLESRVVYDLVDAANGNCRIPQTLIRDKRVDTLFLIPAAQTKDKASIKPEQMRHLIKELKKDFDYILLDCPAGIEEGFKNAIAGADRAIVVTNPEVGPVRDADRVIGLLEANGLGHPKLILNKLNPTMIKHGDMMSIPDVLDILAIDLIGVVPVDEGITVAANRGDPLIYNKDSKTGETYRRIARRITGEHVPILDFEPEKTFFEKVLGLFKFKTKEGDGDATVHTRPTQQNI